MENQYRCLICNEYISSKTHAISRHVKKHNITLDEYIINYYNTDDIIEKCGFCDRNAVAKYEIDHKNLKYRLIYKKGFFCRTFECKSKISLDILGVEYDSKKFEKIGSKSEYLTKLYKTDIETAKNMKYSPKSGDKIFNNKLEDFQKKTLEGQVTWFQESAASDCSILITVFHQQQMIGFCNGRSYKDVKRKHRAALGITLLPDFRGCGLGMKMMEVLIENMKKFSNIKIIELDVMTNNIPAMKMYEKLGFKSAGIFPNAFILPTGEVSDNMTMYLEV
jgi:ribosomal protein S18 acetylase RimI-like enzyme